MSEWSGWIWKELGWREMKFSQRVTKNSITYLKKCLKSNCIREVYIILYSYKRANNL